MNAPVPSVFISYCHADESWKDRLLDSFRDLRDESRISAWDDRQIDPGAEWFEAIQRAMDQAAVAICLISERFLASDFCMQEEIPRLLERRESGRSQDTLRLHRGLSSTGEVSLPRTASGVLSPGDVHWLSSGLRTRGFPALRI